MVLAVTSVEFCKIAHDLACNDETDHRGDKGGRAGDVAPLGAFACRARRADAVVAAADGRILQRADGLFLRVDDLEVLDAALAALRAHHAREWADGRFVNIRHAERRGVHLIARTHGADDGRAAAVRLLHERELARHGVDGVHDIIILRKVELLRRFGQVEHLMFSHDAVRVDRQNALLGDVHLVFADGLARGEDLAVDVRQAHAVVVDEIERAHAGARQRLHRIAAHAADAEHRHTRLRQPLHGVLSQNELCAGKLIKHTKLPNIADFAAIIRQRRGNVNARTLAHSAKIC